ncbi:MAG: TOBE domain-containing protein [Candidatus Helarchaeota archaeon]
MTDISINYKIWLEKNGTNIMGKGGARLLEFIDKTNDLGKAAKLMNCSYKHAWNILQRIKKRYNQTPVITHKGGKGGGGGIELSSLGKTLLRIYKQFNEYIQNSLQNPELWQSYGIKIPFKNILKGEILTINQDKQVCKLKIKLNAKQKINSIITTESVEDLDLKPNKKVIILIKATEIQIGMEES